MNHAQAATSRSSVQLGRAVSSACAVEVWGVLNVTPDSFSDGGRYADEDAAVAHGLRMWREGADVIDVGGESTRPPGRTYGSQVSTVDAQTEAQRVLPVVKRLCAEGVRVSVDTTKADVARAACALGAHIVNDVGCGRDAALLEAAAEADCELVLMHNRGRGEREGDNARYQDVTREALAEVWAALERAEGAGVRRDRIWIDPGLGFAKRAEDSARLLTELRSWVETGVPVLVGASRKSFLAELAGVEPCPPEARLPASLAAACAAQAAGARAVRAHDVAETLQALRVARQLTGQEAACTTS